MISYYMHRVAPCSALACMHAAAISFYQDCIASMASKFLLIPVVLATLCFLNCMTSAFLAAPVAISRGLRARAVSTSTATSPLRRHAHSQSPQWTGWQCLAGSALMAIAGSATRQIRLRRSGSPRRVVTLRAANLRVEKLRLQPKTVKVCPSILSADFSNLGQEVEN